MKNLIVQFISIILFLNLSLAIGISQTTIIQEDFESWPPEGWSTFQSNQTTSWGLCWQNDCGFNSNYSAYNFLCSGCEKWLVTPQVLVTGTDIILSFWERFDESSLEYYGYSGVLISTGSGDPDDGEFVELFTNDPGEEPINWVERTIDLSAFVGQNIYIAFKFEGNWHEWFVDDVFFGPETFTDAGLISLLNPTGISQETGTEDVVVSLENKGTEVVNDFEISWSINGILQTLYQATSMNLQPGQTIELTLGQYDFNTQGSFLISAELNLANDFNPGNNVLEGSYFILPPVDATITRIIPSAYNPLPGLKNVIVEILNNGDNPIDSLVIDWEVEEQAQSPVQFSGLDLQAGERIKLQVGQFNFSEGVHKITSRVTAPADTDTSNDQFSDFISVASFWESFEGPKFPPEGWTSTWSLKDIGFTLPPHGDYYIAGQSDNNFFGVATDTVFTPVLNIEAGQQFRFWRKNRAFNPGNLTILWQEGYQGPIHILEDITTELGVWEEVVVDISSAAGANRIGYVVHSGSHALQYLDLFTSDASPYIQPGDLMVKDFESFYLAKIDEAHQLKFTVKNYSTSAIAGSEYTIKLMKEGGIELASMPGSDLGAWEELDLVINYTFTEIDNHSLYIEVVSEADPNPYNNTTYPEWVYSVPQEIELVDIGQPDYSSLNFPFDYGGDTWTFSSNDITQSLYYENEINSAGKIYGITYYPRNILHTYQDIPLKIWVAPTEIGNLNAGWVPTVEMMLVFDDTIEIKPEEKTLYIPFDEPILYAGSNNLLIQHFVYEPEFPPAFGGFFAKMSNGPVRTIGALNSLEADPDTHPSFFVEHTDFAYATFVVQPVEGVANISGTAYDENDQLFPEVNIKVMGQVIDIQTDSEGNYTLPGLPYEEYTLVATAFGYNDNVKVITADQPSVDLDFYMELRPHIDLSALVVGSNNIAEPLQEVQVIATGYDDYMGETDATGNVLIQDIFGNSSYSVTFRKYGYYDKTISVDLLEDNFDLGNIVLQQEFITPYLVTAIDHIQDAIITWSDPLSSEKEKLANELDYCSFSYTNEPNENVWLGNKFINEDPLTITSVELRFDYYLLDPDYVSIDIFNENEEVIASSEPFLTQRDSTLIIDVPNITIDGNFFVMIHWQNNEVNTHALCVDWTVPGNNFAFIKYPEGNMTLLSDFLGVSPGSFLMRANVLKEGNNSGNSPLHYNIYGGYVDDMQSADDWSKINPLPVYETIYTDDNWPPEESGDFIYAVEAVYQEGESENSFSNPLSVIVNYENINVKLSDILIYPNPANNLITLDISLEKPAEIKIEILNELGQKMEQPLLIQSQNLLHGLDISAYSSGVYTLKLSIGSKQFIKKVVVSK